MPSDTAEFFTSQLDAAAQTLFSSTARQAGIHALNAGVFSYHSGGYYTDNDPGIVWPNPYERDSSLILFASGGRKVSASTFVICHAVDGLTEMTGIDIGRQGNSSLFGELVDRGMGKDGFGVESYADAALRFFIAARKHRIKDNLTMSRDENLPPRIGGVDGGVIARIFRALNSMSSNLAIDHIPQESVVYSGVTYGLATSLYDILLRSQRDPGNSIGNGSRRLGTIFESSEHGVVSVRKLVDFPGEIKVTIGHRPKLGEPNFIIEQFFIGQNQTVKDFVMCDADMYSPQIIANSWQQLDSTRPDEACTPQQEKDIMELLISIIREQNEKWERPTLL